MSIKKAYADFKLCGRGTRLQGLLDTAVQLGYKKVAIDVGVDFTNKKTIIPHVEELDKLLKDTVVFPKGLEVLRRITVSIDDPNLLHHIQGSKILEEYDITALHVMSEKVFQVVVSSVVTDIISLEWSERLGFPLRHTQISQVVKRGTCFEVCYTPAIKDATCCRYIIANIIQLSTLTKGKGIIVSSGAEQFIELRGPLDVINLCHLFGLKDDQCKATITKNCLQVLSHAKQRTTIVKGAISCSLIKEDTSMKDEETSGKGEKEHKMKKRPENREENFVDSDDCTHHTKRIKSE